MTALYVKCGLESLECTNKIWGTLDLGGKGLNASNTQISQMMAGDYPFLPQIVGQLYARAHNATRSCDPDAIIYGDTQLVREWTSGSVLAVAGRYLDALSIQPSGGTIGSKLGGPFNFTDWKIFHHSASRVGGREMPMVFPDNGFAFPHRPYQKHEWHEYASQAAAGEAYRAWVVGATNGSFILAMNKCQYTDRCVAQPALGLKPGMVDFNGTAHEPFASVVRKAIHEAATQNTGGTQHRASF